MKAGSLLSTTFSTPPTPCFPWVFWNRYGTTRLHHATVPGGQTCQGWEGDALTPSVSQQDVSAKKSLRFPELYTIGQQDQLFNYRIFSVTLLHGVSTSLTSFYIALWAFEDHVGSRTVGDYESFSVTVATSALLSVLMEVSTALLFPVSELGMSGALEAVGMDEGLEATSPNGAWVVGQKDPRHAVILPSAAADDLPWGRDKWPNRSTSSSLHKELYVHADHPGHQVLDGVVLPDGHSQLAALLPLLLPDPEHRCLQDRPHCLPLSR